MNVLSVHDLNVAFGALDILRDVSLDLDAGETYALLGSNGAGKSTLLRACCGLVKLRSGRVVVGGHDLRGDRAWALAQVGYVAQRFGLYEDLTVEENLLFYASCYGLSGDSLRASVDDGLRRFDLTSLRSHTVATLSYGWKQRLALAAATCHQPSLLLLDEATAGLDPSARCGIWEILTAYAKNGMAILLVTHHSDDADRCGSVGYIHQSRLMDRAPVPAGMEA